MNTCQFANASSNSSIYPLKFIDSCGRKITIKSEPKRILSVAPNITETLCALGAEDKLVGKTEYCNYPEKIKYVPSIGNLISPNVEKIIQLNPDVIIASDHFQKNIMETLTPFGINVVVLKPNNSVDGTYEIIHRVGQITNHTKEADELISSIQTKIKSICTKINTSPSVPPHIYYVIEVSDQESYTAGKGTFISHMIQLAGGINAAKDAVNWKYSLEKLLDDALANWQVFICCNRLIRIAANVIPIIKVNVVIIFSLLIFIFPFPT